MNHQNTEDVDKTLWVTLKSGPGTFYIIGGAETHPGRFFVVDSSFKQRQIVSRYQISSASTEADYWIKGFTQGSAPQYPKNFTGTLLPLDHPVVSYFEEKRSHYLESGWGIPDCSYHGPNCYSFLLQYLLLTRQVTSEEIATWIAQLGENSTPDFPTLSTPKDLYAWVRLLEIAPTLPSEELIQRLKHPADDVDATRSFALYLNFIRCRNLPDFGKDSLSRAIRFFFQDAFWADHARDLLALLSDSQAENQKRFEEKRLTFIDDKFFVAVFYGLGARVTATNN